MTSKGKAVPLESLSGPEGSRKLMFPDYMTTAQGGGKVVSLTHLAAFTARKYSWYSFLLGAEVMTSALPKGMFTFMKYLHTRYGVYYARWYELRHRIELKIRAFGHIPKKCSKQDLSPFKGYVEKRRYLAFKGRNTLIRCLVV
jgi:hypothetical protein